MKKHRVIVAGLVFVKHCEWIAQESDEAIALIGEQGESRRELRVTYSTAKGERFVAPLIRRPMIQHPKLSLSSELTNCVVDLVAEGFDIAVRTGRFSDPC